MNAEIVIAPLLPLPIIVALIAIGAALVVYGLIARVRGGWLRAAALVALGAALFNPSIRSEERERLTDIAVAVIDRSQSQQALGRPEQTDKAEAALREALSRLANTEVRFVTARSGLAAEDDGTRLFSSLDTALKDIPPERYAGAIFLTDGQVHDVPSDAARAAGGAAVHTLLTGKPDERDRRIVLERAPRFGIVGKEQTIRFRVEDSNGEGRSVNVTIKTADGATSTMNVASGASTELTVTVGRGGQNITELEAEAMPDEISTQNNRAIAVIEGIRDRLRVLLVSGEPHPGERTWRNLLKSDPAVDLVHFTILRPPEKQDGTPIRELSLIAFPTRELFVDKLSEFDLVIFDRYQRQGVLPLVYLANVANYVREGGAVLIAAGPDFAEADGLYNTPLSDVLSTVPTGQILEGAFKPKLTVKGQRHPVTSGLPGSAGETPTWGRWLRLVEADPGDGEALMSGPQDKPLLVLARRGEGRVAQLLSDHGWLWARGYEGGGPQMELLRRLAHWLMKEPDLEEESLRARQELDKLVIERRTMADKAEDVKVEMPLGKSETVALSEQSPGLWVGRLTIAEAGLHRMSEGDLRAVAAAGSADPKEAADLRATPDKMRPAAEATGGGIEWLATRDGGLPQLLKVAAGRQMAGSGWFGLRDNGAYRTLSVSEIPLFASLVALGLLLLGLGALWYREGR